MLVVLVFTVTSSPFQSAGSLWLPKENAQSKALSVISVDTTGIGPVTVRKEQIPQLPGLGIPTSNRIDDTFQVLYYFAQKSYFEYEQNDTDINVKAG